jgi:hypothetical protein
MRVLIFVIFLSQLFYCQPYSEAVEKWSIPEKVLVGAWYPHITRDGQRLYFKSNGYHYMDKTDSGWTQRVRLNDNINGLPFLNQLFISPDKKTLYITATQNWLIFRSFWDENLQDWGVPHLLTDNGINGGNGGWIVSSFLDDTTMILNYMDESFITFYDSLTNMWSAPISYPCESCRLFSDYGFWVTPDRKKYYASNESYSQGRGKDIFVAYLMDSGRYSYSYSLNFCMYMDSLYDQGLIKGNNEWKPTFTDDGRTIYFMANYDSSTRQDIYVSRMIVDENGDSILSSKEKEVQLLTDETLYLYPSYPNPFNPSATIKYSVSKSCMVNLTVYDLLGRQLAVLQDGYMNPGVFTATFNADNYAGGVYIYRLQAGEFLLSRKMVLMK